ncbi:4-phosphoerythronate dehydrogenase [Paramuribaculum intestinale]|uniref:4-phosphoerythronate dehydrogenase n=1 Tax=Paramuribaculum intestinale TaxID=2094151 RepID=UPI00272C1501|nr:4-phosphoerythronate dehydrogenase [Paramuribaculum intestinale]
MDSDNHLNARRPEVIIEANIPFIRGILEPVADVSYLEPERFTPETVATADAIVTRTRVKCCEGLLGESRVSFIASATIGLDHVDLPWCRSHGITVVNAPGCNAPAVAQYVFASLLSLPDFGPLDGKTLGVVGVGNVGRIVADWGERLGMRVMRCDPPRALAEGATGFSSIEEIAADADAITFHTPLTRSGDCPTYHLCDDSLLAGMTRRPVIINSARGPVADNEALIRALRDKRISDVVIDCWENEPDISRTLLDMAAVATPHIAGYSRQGKIRATQMAVDALTAHFGLPATQWSEKMSDGAKATISAGLIAASYDPMADTAMLRRDPASFERLRNHYHLREELS